MTLDKDMQLIWERYNTEATAPTQFDYTWNDWLQNPDYAKILKMRSDDFKSNYTLDNLDQLKDLLKKTDPGDHSRELRSLQLQLQDAILTYEYGPEQRPEYEPRVFDSEPDPSKLQDFEFDPDASKYDPTSWRYKKPK